MPDTSSLPANSIDLSSAAPQPQASAPSGPAKPSLWRNVLQGALAGLANSAGSRSFGEGAARGAGGELNRQASVAAGQRQDAQDQQNIKFANANEAYRPATLANQDQELHLRTQDAQDAHDRNVAAMVDWNVGKGYADYDAIPNNGQAVSDMLTSATAQTGAASVPPGSLVTTHTIYVPKQGPSSATQRTKEFNNFAGAYGLGSVDSGVVSPANYTVLQNLRQGLDAKGDAFTDKQLPQQITLMQQRLKRIPADADPSVVKDVTNTLASLKAQQQSIFDQGTKRQQTNADAETEGARAAVAGRWLV